jgi:carboxylesterase type B
MNPGINHCAEICFAFHNVGLPQSRIATGGTPAVFALPDKVSMAWISFALHDDKLVSLMS